MTRAIVLTIWFIINYIFKVNSSYSFVLGIILLMLSAVSIVLDRQGFALRLATYAFGFLVVGMISYIRELKINDKND